MDRKHLRLLIALLMFPVTLLVYSIVNGCDHYTVKVGPASSDIGVSLASNSNTLASMYGGSVSPTPAAGSLKSADCLFSRSQCLSLIEQNWGKVPKLVSFRTDSSIVNRHMKSGEAFIAPNIVHLISFGTDQPFKFYNYIAYKSFHKFLKPHAIFLWADQLPPEKCEWWQLTRQEVANIYFVKIKPPLKIGRSSIKFIAHASDVLRLKIIKGIELK